MHIHRQGNDAATLTQLAHGVLHEVADTHALPTLGAVDRLAQLAALCLAAGACAVAFTFLQVGHGG